MSATVEPATFRVRSMHADLRWVALRRPATSGDWAGAGWPVPDPDALVRQHEALCDLLATLGCRVDVLDAVDGLVDATYVRDPVLVTDAGILALRAAKPIRQAEGERLVADLEPFGVPAAGRLSEGALADGGDLVWIGERTLWAARGYRTNDAGLRELAAAVGAEGAALERFDLAHHLGPERVLHLMSFLSPVAPDLAVVYEPLAPVALLDALRERGIRWVAVDDDEYETLACNVLAVRPGVVVMADGNSATRRKLEAVGCEVHAYAASEISIKGEGGPTCLTLPLLRA